MRLYFIIPPLLNPLPQGERKVVVRPFRVAFAGTHRMRLCRGIRWDTECRCTVRQKRMPLQKNKAVPPTAGCPTKILPLFQTFQNLFYFFYSLLFFPHLNIKKTKVVICICIIRINLNSGSKFFFSLRVVSQIKK